MSTRSTKFIVGTSGYSYREWKPSFYPAKLSAKDMLAFYAERFATVELNSTFRSMPEAGAFEAWAAQVPASFRFAIKAPQTITHRKRLKETDAATDELLAACSVLKRRQGPLLFQLPPNFKKDLPRLDAFLKHFGKRAKGAFEFRHESWLDDEVFACLRKHKVALCIADADDLPAPRLLATAPFGYVRLRRDRYTTAQLKKWVERLRALSWTEAFVYFKHDDAGEGPKFAARFRKLAEKV